MQSNKRILISGNKGHGVASGIDQIMSSDYHLEFCSRKNGFDLTSESGRQRFVELSLGYDVFINNAALWRFNQTLLAEAVWKSWTENNKTGHIINLGSTADRQIYGGNWTYPAEKKALRHQSISQAMSSLGGSGIKVTYLAYGYVSTPNIEKKHPTKKKHEPVEIARLIKWIIEYPVDNSNLIEIVLDPIQSQR